MKSSSSLISLFLFWLESSQGFQSIQAQKSLPSSSDALNRKSPSSLKYSLRDADMMEIMVGGERYEMVPLPDSMMDTTLFVGNLDEFCKDEDLSNLFQAVSTLQSVPACVARKPNMASLRYGFVTFLTVQEKEAAIMRYHGSDFCGKSLKVEAIRDHPKMGRVKVPERIVSYVLGQAKKPPPSNKSSLSSLRSIARLESKKEKVVSSKELKRRKQREERKTLQSQIEFPLNPVHQEELLRAARRGYVSLEGRGLSRGRKKNSLACAHRQYCDEREHPQIVLCKASGSGGKRSPLDCLIVDLSPLRLTAAVGDELVDDFMIKWKTQILTAATTSGMDLRRDYREEDCKNLSLIDDEDLQEECSFEITDNVPLSTEANEVVPSMEYTITLTDEDSWATQPISRLPVVSLGVFEGERSKAKAMAKELAELWGIPAEPLDYFVETSDSSKSDSGNKRRGNKARRHRRNENRRRRRNGQRELDMFFR